VPDQSRSPDESATRPQPWLHTGPVQTETVGQRFDRAPNAFNLLRLALALEVVAWHAVQLRAAHLPPALEAFTRDVAVDGFFALSGFLIVASWTRHPDLGVFLLARARRIVPGLWVCLLVTALVIVPVASWAAGTPAPSVGEQLRYVGGNVAVIVGQQDVGTTAAALPLHEWNGSLWTLVWELRCYLMVAALGVLGILNRRILTVLAVALWAYAAAFAALGVSTRVYEDLYMMPQRGFLLFCLGGLLWLHRDRVRLDARLAVLAAATIPAGVLLVDNYRIIAAPGLAYLVIWAGFAVAHWPRTVVRNDLSYGVYIYGFPIQQALLLVGWSTGWLPFFLVSAGLVLAAAAASWFLVERPAQRLGRKRPSAGLVRARPVQPPPTVAVRA
jgi:peptidoglycan/LPS O-acetylase OafA/YrhL